MLRLSAAIALVVFLFFLLAATGLAVGSFLAALTWRMGRSQSILFGRSRCPSCRTPISWLDNIPLLSYFLLGRRCRNCRAKISPRYPIIEATTGIVFVLFGWILFFGFSEILVEYQRWLGLWTLPFFLAILSLLIAIAVVDIEHQFIPDSLIGLVLLFSLSVLIFFSPSPTFFVHFFWAILLSTFIVFLHWLTRGKGMGLGDAKLALALGLVAGKLTPLLFLAAVISGAVVGIMLVAVKLARFGKPIPFGPFLIFGFFIVLFFERILLELIVPGV